MLWCWLTSQGLTEKQGFESKEKSHRQGHFKAVDSTSPGFPAGSFQEWSSSFPAGRERLLCFPQGSLLSFCLTHNGHPQSECVYNQAGLLGTPFQQTISQPSELLISAIKLQRKDIFTWDVAEMLHLCSNPHTWQLLDSSSISLLSVLYPSHAHHPGHIFWSPQNLPDFLLEPVKFHDNLFFNVSL